MKKSRKIVLAGIAAAVILFAASQMMGGVRVFVRNTGGTSTDSTIVHVTGRSYRLGEIGIGEKASVRVQPVGESHVEVSFVTPNGQQERVKADCYFESSNYSGTIVIDIADGELVDVENNVSVGGIF